MAYSVLVLPDAEDDLDKIPEPMHSRLRTAIHSLGETPRPPGTRKMAGLADVYRIRVGNYRVVYRIRDEKRLVIIAAAAARGKVYPLAKRRIK
jgi:mRNA interferase RelE/StbE